MKWTDEYVRTRFKARVQELRSNQGLDPDVCPKIRWLRENGFGGIHGYADRKDMTVKEVLLDEDLCNFNTRSEKPLGINHTGTRKKIKQWIKKEERYGKWNDRTIRDAKTAIRTIAEIAESEVGHTNLMRVLRYEGELHVDAIEDICFGLDDEYDDGTCNNYIIKFEKWADYMKLREKIDDHKVDVVRKKMDWKYNRNSPEYKLDYKQLRRILDAAIKLDKEEEDRPPIRTALIVALAGFGSRRQGPRILRIDQIYLDASDPYVEYGEERKTGRSTVPIMAGVEVISEWIQYNKEQEDTNDIWLFPSQKTGDGRISNSTVNKLVRECVEEAGVEFPNGEKPTPKDFRSWWYSHEMKARKDFHRMCEKSAENQGQKSGKIVANHYIPERDWRDHFREFQQRYFEAAFGEQLVHAYDAVVEERSEQDSPELNRTLDEFQLQDEEGDNYESPAVTDPSTAQLRARLRKEHSALVDSPMYRYPPDTKQVAKMAGVIVGIAVPTGLLWGSMELLYYNPMTGTVGGEPVAPVALIFAFLFIIFDTPELEQHDNQKMTSEG